MELATNNLIKAGEIQSAIYAIENDASLYEETNFNNRANAIDFIEFHIIDRAVGLQQDKSLKIKLDKLLQRAENIKYELERVNTTLFQQLRKKISTHIYTGSSFREMISKYFGDYNNTNDTCKIGYDNLDVFMNGLLSEQPLPETTIELAPEMVFYQKTPARIILKLIERSNLKERDVLFDLGSGLGQVAILVNLISVVKVIGVEYEPAYCSYAESCVRMLSLRNIGFINADARNADYSEGTVFFMYTPFIGSMLQDVLNILKAEAHKRMIRIFSYGPCSAQLKRQTWLNPVNGKGDHRYELYEFRAAF